MLGKFETSMQGLTSTVVFRSLHELLVVTIGFDETVDASNSPSSSVAFFVASAGGVQGTCSGFLTGFAVLFNAHVDTL